MDTESKSPNTDVRGGERKTIIAGGGVGPSFPAGPGKVAASTQGAQTELSGANTILAPGGVDGGAGVSHSAPTMIADSTPPQSVGDADATLPADSSGGNVVPTVRRTAGFAPDGAVATAAAATVIKHTILPSARLENGSITWIHSQKARLELLDLLGEGGAGEVLVAMDHDIGRKVAVKKIRSNVKSATMVMRFIDEIRTVGRLEHPNIIPIHDVGVDESGDYYFIMKYIEGETLEEIIERLKAGDRKTHAAYPFERRVEVFRGILEAVRYAHSKNIIHRDIKPANIMVGPFGEVILMDWGIAREIGSKATDEAEALLAAEEGTEESQEGRFWKTKAGSLIGTPAYMSPEQGRGEPLDERSDIYALSVLLHEFLGLNHYLEGKKNMAEVLLGVQEESAGIFSMSNGKGQGPVPMDLVWYVRKGLHKEKTERFQTIGEMIARLDLRAQGIIPVECHITLMKRINGSLMRFTDSHPMLATMGMLAGLGLGIYGVIHAIT